LVEIITISNREPNFRTFSLDETGSSICIVGLPDTVLMENWKLHRSSRVLKHNRELYVCGVELNNSSKCGHRRVMAGSGQFFYQNDLPLLQILCINCVEGSSDCLIPRAGQSGNLASNTERSRNNFLNHSVLIDCLTRPVLYSVSARVSCLEIKATGA
jgi:hypothetical protein